MGISAQPDSCNIPIGSDACSVELIVGNPEKSPMEVWVRGIDGIEKQVTGRFSSPTFRITAPWIPPGVITFNLYDMSNSDKKPVNSTQVTGVAKVGIIGNPSSCKIPAGGGSCSVTLLVSDPDGLPFQIWVKGPDNMEKQVTGTLTNKIFSMLVPWISRGNTTFNMYDVSGGGKSLLANCIVSGM